MIGLLFLGHDIFVHRSALCIIALKIKDTTVFDEEKVATCPANTTEILTGAVISLFFGGITWWETLLYSPILGRWQGFGYI